MPHNESPVTSSVEHDYCIIKVDGKGLSEIVPDAENLFGGYVIAGTGGLQKHLGDYLVEHVQEQTLDVEITPKGYCLDLSDLEIFAQHDVNTVLETYRLLKGRDPNNRDQLPLIVGDFDGEVAQRLERMNLQQLMPMYASLEQLVAEQ